MIEPPDVNVRLDFVLDFGALFTLLFCKISKSMFKKEKKSCHVWTLSVECFHDGAFDRI